MWWRPPRISPSIWGNVTCAPRSLAGKQIVLRKTAGPRKRSIAATRLRHGRPRPAERHQHDLRRNAETERHDAAAQPARDDDVAVDPHMAISQPVAVSRRHHRRPPEQSHLTAVGMS